MTRWIPIVIAIGCAKPPAARPVTQLELAAQANREGEQLMHERRYARAAARFFDAAARTSEPLYFLNLCGAYRADGKLDDALAACEAAQARAPNAVFAAEAARRVRQIEDAKLASAPPDERPPAPKVSPLPVAPDDAFRLVESSGPPSGSGQAAIASRLNTEGTRAIQARQFAVASTKFRDAAARVPEPGYLFNLGLALYLEGKFAESLTACDATLNSQPAPTLARKAEQLIVRVQTEAKSQGVDLR